MKISMNLPDDHQYSIMQRVLDGTLTIESVEEFNEILQIYPEDPILWRKYADLLLKNSDFEVIVGGLRSMGRESFRRWSKVCKM